MSLDRFDSLVYTLARYNEVTPQLAFRRDRPADWARQARTKLQELIGPFPTERVPTAVEYGPEIRREGYTRQLVAFSTRANLSACGYFLVPDGQKAPAPAVLCAPGHGRGVAEIVGITEDGKERDHLDGYQHDFAIQCVRKGYVTLALEPLGFGRRRDVAARERGLEESSCQPAAGSALLLGETMVGWRVWDAMRAIDLLADHPDVDSSRIGMMGISGGGTVTLYTSALDDRVKVACLSGSFCSFKDSIFSISHCIDNYVPGLLRWFGAADLAGLIAPRYLFVENGTHDVIFPKPGVEAALKEVGTIFAVLGVPGHLDHAFFEGGHHFDGTAMFQRLAGWL